MSDTNGQEPTPPPALTTQEINRNQSYLLRTMTWPDGTVETGKEADIRLTRSGFRREWDDRSEQLRRAHKKAGTPISLNDARMMAFKEFPPDECSEPLVDLANLNLADQRFVRACREGLLIRRIPQDSSIDDTLRWIAANVNMDVPDVVRAPSKAALSWAIDARCDPKIRASFWSTYQSKRMSPGEKKPKKSAFKEDDESNAERDYEERRDEVMKRLFGEGE